MRHIRQATTLPTHKRLFCAALVIAGAVLGGCNQDRPAVDAKPGQALASVNGEEITVLQLNEEMQRAGVSAAQQQAASKQLLQALIDRELLESEAAKEKVDRDPKVMQAIERARSLIIAQAYMQKRVGDVAPPAEADIEAYFNKHPEFFTKRRQFAMSQLVLPASAVTPELRAAADRASSLQEVAVYLDAHHIQYGRARATRSTADLKPELANKLLSMPKGQLFLAQEGPRAMLISIDEVREAPVSLAAASPQIAQYLANVKNKEMAQAEIQRLRATAKIEYLNKSLAPVAGAPGTLQTAATAALAANGATAAAGGALRSPEPGGIGLAPADMAGAGAGAGQHAGSDAGSAAGNEAASDAGSEADKKALERGVAGLK